MDGRPKDWITKMQLHGLLRHRNPPTDEPIQDQLAQLPFGVAQHCLQKSLCWKLRNFILRNKAFVYFTCYSFCNLFSLPFFTFVLLSPAAMPLSARNSDSHYHRFYAPTQARIDSHCRCLKFFPTTTFSEKIKASLWNDFRAKVKSMLQEFVFNVCTTRAEVSGINLSGTLLMKPNVHAGMVTGVVSVNAGARGLTFFGAWKSGYCDGFVTGKNGVVTHDVAYVIIRVVKKF